MSEVSLLAAPEVFGLHADRQKGLLQLDDCWLPNLPIDHSYDLFMGFRDIRRRWHRRRKATISRASRRQSTLNVSE